MKFSLVPSWAGIDGKCKNGGQVEMDYAEIGGAIGLNLHAKRHAEIGGAIGLNLHARRRR